MSPTRIPPFSSGTVAAPTERRWRAWLLLALLPVLLLVRPARAEVDMDGATDPPARVGRVSELRGPVDLSREPGAAWEPAQVNQPVTTQTAFWVPPGSQAELRVGSAAVRMDGNTQAVFSQLDDHGIALDVAQGTVRARVRSLPTGDAFSLSADGVRAEALMPGDYRVGYDPDRRVYTVRALAGRLRVVTPTNSVDLAAGQESLIERGSGHLQLRAIGERDDFDLWAEARDREHDRLIASRYVSPETTGIEALDDHGRWEVDSGYGAIWYPSAVAYGWAPYRYGRWAWVAPWGWTWVDDSPWGFAPFHYGRWALVGHRWGWVPGPIVARPVWAPALVGWIGGHSGNLSWSIGFGSSPSVGWFPLAPQEVYYPPYRHTVVYVDRVNHWRERGPDRYPRVPYDPQRPRDPQRAGDDGPGRDPQRDGPPRYRYAQHRDALTVVREDTFRNARPVGRERIALDPQQAASLRPVIVRTPEVGGPAGDPGARSGQAPRGRVETLPAPPPRVRTPRQDDLRRQGTPNIPPEILNERHPQGTRNFTSPSAPSARPAPPPREIQRPRAPAERPEDAAPRRRGPAAEPGARVEPRTPRRQDFAPAAPQARPSGGPPDQAARGDIPRARAEERRQRQAEPQQGAPRAERQSGGPRADRQDGSQRSERQARQLSER
jgi:hypothetical protein